jgi:hypothetical protein
MVRNMESYYDEELLAPRPNSMLEDHFFPAVRDCLHDFFAATLHTGVPPPPGDEPCRGDRDPLTTVEINGIMNSLQ